MTKDIVKYVHDNFESDTIKNVVKEYCFSVTTSGIVALTNKLGVSNKLRREECVNFLSDYWCIPP